MPRRTDLALESREIYQEENNCEVPGVEVETRKKGRTDITVVDVVNKSGEREIGKPMGRYITLEMPYEVKDKLDDFEDVCIALCDELKPLVDIPNDGTVLIVGLGNRSITPDSLGPKVISSALITRHLFDIMPDKLEDGLRPVCGITPGVLGITGIETGEIIRGVVDRVKPDLVIAIDALASRKMERINRTVQISDTGINPGSGIGNHRNGISRETLGIPVIAIGVPTVVDAATMANDTIDLVIDELIGGAKQGSAFFKMLRDIDREEKYKLIEEVLTPKDMGNLIVTVADVDEIVETVAQVIANGINMALHPSVTLEQLNRY